ncbi:hypothetical protein [Jeotgalibacillus campisalis]|uniref:Uncharacterized protein n=1 Tax=Jeotgalibacillus campisalis TaxID=220754 RepID=A0A0C2VGH3_9BACL|nr:hypothetical protein [Jeotgalibacillus campisalis]KIL43088.1 hypothetical protein KR50_34910 [Jeotgalibacillus campisalis]
MKRVVGIFLIIQTVLTYLILRALNQVSVSITEAAVHTKSGGLTLSWSDDLSAITYILLIIVVIPSIYLILAKNKKIEG